MARKDQNVRLIELGVAHVNINARDQGHAIAALAQENARSRVAASAPAPLVDNSSGTTSESLIAVTTPSIFKKDGATTLAAKADFDTQIGLLEDAHEELVSKTNELILLVAGPTARKVGATAGEAADNTIAAIADQLGLTTNVVDAVTGIAEINVARNNQAALAAGINYVSVAMGMSTLPDNCGGIFDLNATNYVMTDASTTAAAITADGEDSLTLASVNSAMGALRNNVATMSAKLNELRGTINVGPFVVATSSPRTRFLAADTDPS